MPGGGDYDDAVDIIDVWLQENPIRSPWEREETILPWQTQSELPSGLRFDVQEEEMSLTRF